MGSDPIYFRSGWRHVRVEDDGDAEHVLLDPLAHDRPLAAGDARGGAPVDVADVVALAVFAVAEVLERLAHLRRQRHTTGLIAAAGRKRQPAERGELRVDQELSLVHERAPRSEDAERESRFDAIPAQRVVPAPLAAQADAKLRALPAL